MNEGRKILITSIGLSPNVLVSTTKAMCMAKPAIIPDEIHVITTGVGLKKIKEDLIENGKWEKEIKHLKKTNELAKGKLRFDITKSVKIISSEDRSFDDVGTSEECDNTAEFILNFLKEWTLKKETSLIISIAGGRKSTSALMLGCMSLIGRNQDRVFHVISNENQSVEQLSEITYVRMRRWLLKYINTSSYKNLVQRAQGIIDQSEYPNIIIDLEKRTITVNDKIKILRSKAFTLLFIFIVLIKEKDFFERTWNDFDDFVMNNFTKWEDSLSQLDWYNTGKDWINGIKEEAKDDDCNDLYNNDWKVPTTRLRQKFTELGFDEFDIIPQMDGSDSKLFPKEKIIIRDSKIYDDFLKGLD